MNEPSIPPVENLASSAVAQKSIPWNVIVAGGFLTLLLLGVGVWMFVEYKTQKDVLTPQPQSVSGEWRVYENSEIGIVFEYPAAWGEVVMTRTAACYPANAYSPAQLEQMKKDVAASPNDPCQQVRLIVGGAIIVQTATPLANKYPVPRDGYWGDMSGSVTSDAYITSFCTKHTAGTCNLISNTQKIPIVHYEGVIDMGDVAGEVYLVHTKHPLYYGLALSPSRLPVKDNSDFRRLIETLRFIPSN